MNQVGVVIREAGAAIVTADHDKAGACVITAIEQLPFNPEQVAERITALDLEEPKDSQFLIDADGLGNALWTIVGPTDKKRFRLYEERGMVRQALVDSLVVAIARDALHFRRGLSSEDAMTRALLNYKRTVREDGEVGTELVVALCLAVLPRPKPLRHLAFLA